jgi:hypothetical protein
MRLCISHDGKWNVTKKLLLPYHIHALLAHVVTVAQYRCASQYIRGKNNTRHTRGDDILNENVIRPGDG